MSKDYDDNEVDNQLLGWLIQYGYEPVVIPLFEIGLLQDYNLLLPEGFLSYEVSMDTGSVRYKLRKAIAQYRLDKLKRMEKQNE